METEVKSVSEEQTGISDEDEEEEEEEENSKLTELDQALNFWVSDPPELHPQSYRMNSPHENHLLAIANNFQRQYLHLYPDRKPLLLCPVNECGVKKFVSTTVRPTTTSHVDLQTWQGCASFVADFLSLEPLDPPTDLPNHLFSSTSVLRSQKANCFEFATLLCSLLLGVNYDAYCVSGYAVREMCLLDQSLQQCPLLDAEVKSEIPEQTEKKYTARRPRDLRSRFLIQQEKKKQEAEAALLQKNELQELQRLQPADSLRGLRVHCWVLVLSGSRGVQESFFIDPLTGNSYTTDSDNFLGIESVWNNLNYHVNLQDCSSGCTGVMFDVDDLKLWEPVLYGATSRKQLTREVLKRKERMLMNKLHSDDEEELPRVFEMPRSWVSYFSISEKDLEMRWPRDKKVTSYRKAKLERFSPFVNADGLVTRWTAYKDLDCSEVTVVKEWYKYRTDCLEEKQINKLENFTSEHFGSGNSSHLLYHRWKSVSSGTEREMKFSCSREDNLVRIVNSPGEIMESFEGREDFLYYRHTYFNQQTTKIEDLNVLKIVERFHRNGSKPAKEDVAERVFLLAESQILLTYHLMDQRFTASRRIFMKPETDKKLSHNMVPTFQVDLSEEPLVTKDLNRMLQFLMKQEKKVALDIHMSLMTMTKIVDHREEEDNNVKLWSTELFLAQARREKRERESKAAEEQRWLQEKDEDVLAPLLIRLGNPEVLSREEANQLYQTCLTKFRERMMEQTNLLQKQIEEEEKALHESRKKYQSSKSQSEAFTDKVFQVSVIQKRLDRHRKTAQDKYNALNQKLRQDPRLAPHLNS